MNGVNIFAPQWDPCDSYGRLAHELGRGIEAQGYSVNRFGDGAPLSPIRAQFGGLLLGYPTLYQHYGVLASAGPRVAVTMFESTKLPDLWVENLNKCDAVVVPSRFLVDVFQACGVNSPIYVVPLGISSAFAGSPTLRTLSEDRPMKFLAIADRGRRKGWHKALFAFEQAFGDDPRYQLTLKARKFPLEITNPNVTVIEGDYSDGELASLYRAHDVMIFPSAGEGFGLPPREFTATGGIALATNWGGTADDISSWGFPIPYVMADAWQDNPKWYGQLGQWADVDVVTLTKLLEMVAENFELWATVAHDISSPFVRNSYQWQAFADGVLAIYNEVAYERTR